MQKSAISISVLSVLKTLLRLLKYSNALKTLHVPYEQSLLGRDNEAGAQIQVVYPPSCQLSLRVKLETFIIECQPRGNPKNFTFSWRKNNLTFSDFSHVSSGEASNHGKDQKITLLYLLILEFFNSDIDTVMNTQYL